MLRVRTAGTGEDNSLTQTEGRAPGSRRSQEGNPGSFLPAWAMGTWEVGDRAAWCLLHQRWTHALSASNLDPTDLDAFTLPSCSERK